MNDPQPVREFLFRRLTEPPELFGLPLDMDPLWWLALGVPVLLAALALVLVIYLRESKTIGQWALLLGGLRVLTCVTLCFLWLLPAVRQVEWTTQKSRVVVLFDVSGSMQVSDEPPTDAPGQPRPTRTDRVLELLAPATGPRPVSAADPEAGAAPPTDFLSRLLEKNALVCYRFGDQLDPAAWAVTPQDRPSPDVWAAALQPQFRTGLASPLPRDLLAELTRAGRLLEAAAPLDEEARRAREREVAANLDRALADRDQTQVRLLSRTNLGAALLDVLRKEAGNTVQGVILISDGRANAGSDQELEEAVRLARQQRVPLFTVGVGRRQEAANLRLVDVLAPARVQPEDEFPVRVAVEGDYLAGRPEAGVTLTIERPGKPPQEMTQQVVLGKVNDRLARGAAEFRVANPDKVKGDWKLRARVAPIPGERTRADNVSEEPAVVKVDDRKLSVLIVSAAPPKEYQFLRSLLVREGDKFDLTLNLQSATEGSVQDVDPKRLLLRFPEELRERDEDPNNLGNYDVVIAIDPDWRALSAAARDNLHRWVDQLGGGLVVVAGPVHTFALARAEELASVRQLYPVVLDSSATYFTIAERPSKDPWALNWGPTATAQPFLDIADAGEGGRTLEGWEQFFEANRGETGSADTPAKRGFHSFFPLQDVKPGAAVLARFSDPDPRFLTPRGERQPFFVLHKVGKGPVFYIGSGETWRLRSYSEKFHERFWTKLIRHLGKREAARGLLVVGSRYAEGETVVVEAQLFDAELRPLRAETAGQVLLKVVTPAGMTDVPKDWRDGLPMQPDGGRPGWFVARFPVAKAGRYGLELKIPGSNEQLAGRFRVEGADPERDDTRPDFALLHRLAAEAKDVKLQDERLRPELAQALARARELVTTQAQEAPPGAPVLTAANEQDRLFFETDGARLIPDCLENSDVPFRTEGKVHDVWDKGWDVFFDLEHPEHSTGPPWALLLVVGLLSAEWLTRKLLRLA